MTIRMNNLERLTLDEMKEFVKTSRHVSWSAVEPGGAYGLIEGMRQRNYRVDRAAVGPIGS